MSGAQAPSRFVPTLIAGCLGVFVAQVAYSLPASILGTIQQDLGISGADLTWVSAAFAAAMVIFELTFGVVGDIFGRKQLLLGGLALLAAGELITILGASHVHTLWIGQAVAGIGAGALYPISLTMIAAAAPDAKARANAIALWAGFLSVGAAVSPITAGALAENGHWKSSFWIPLALAAVAFVISFAASNSSAPEGRKLDLPGQATLIIGLVSLIWALTQGSEIGYGEGRIIVGLLFAAVFLVAFVIVELRSASPLIHLSLFTNRAFAITGITAVVGMFAYLATCFSMTMFLGSVAHIGAVWIGILFLVIQVPALLLVPLVAKLIHSVSPQWVLTAGFAFIGVAAFWSSTFDAHDFVTSQGAPDNSQWVRFIGPMILNGIGFALTVGSITAVAINSVPLRLAGMASATTNLLRDFGFALGPVLGGALYNSIAKGRFNDGLDAAFGESAKQGFTVLHQPLDPHVPTDAVMGALHGISGAGPLAVNSVQTLTDPASGKPFVDMPFALHDLAFTSLSNAFNTTFLVAALCALVSAVLTAVGLIGAKSGSDSDREFAAEMGTDVIHEVTGAH
ncbi:MFS transporter [Nocardioides sp. Kera G14]|uniref:MFS transporter n=1 Tax=Nocardioides sp. Kera G14 TaxID=2884264 RepID=UPI001D104DB6|nr:MFS transporter [Nocardioides sp. Kera G14]UDY23475.1 MFS transporter [Nocardioides sp. Kera G14]